MICQNCRANIDNDLVFCTSCGARLQETFSQTPTVLMNDSVVTKAVSSSPPPQKSNFKWIILLVALLAIPCGLLAAYLLFKPNNQPVAQNTNQSNPPVSSPTRKVETAQNNSPNTVSSNANAVNSNAAPINQNSQNPEPTPDAAKTEIMNERIEISPNSNYAVPFKVEQESAKIFGDVKLVRGEPLVGYIFLKNVYEEHYVDPNYKVFSFDVGKDSTIEQRLPEGDYVLILVNQNKQSSMIQSDLYLTK